MPSSRDNSIESASISNRDKEKISHKNDSSLKDSLGSISDEEPAKSKTDSHSSKSAKLVDAFSNAGYATSKAIANLIQPNNKGSSTTV